MLVIGRVWTDGPELSATSPRTSRPGAHPHPVQLVSAVRSIAAARALTGRPDALAGHPVGPVARGVVRFLGVRQSVQAAVVERTGWHDLSAAVDLLHAATMLPLVAAPRWRRFGATQAATAALLIALEVHAGRR